MIHGVSTLFDTRGGAENTRKSCDNIWRNPTLGCFTHQVFHALVAETIIIPEW
jgi:hypothetical protein